MLTAIAPFAPSLQRQFRERLRERNYSALQAGACLAITPGAACRLESTAAFFEEVEEQGRRLAKLNVPPSDLPELLREFDALAAAALQGKYAPAREQLQLATLLVMNQASFEVRESEAQALFGLSRAEVESGDLDELPRRVVRILTRAFRARSGRLVMIDHPAGTPRVARRESKHLFYSMPGIGMLQFGFSKPWRWLPRDLALLAAAESRCREALEYRRMAAAKRAAEENERRRIGRELHDEAGQSLLALRLDLELMERIAPEPMLQPLRDARAITEKTVEELRRIVAALSPAMLERLGLEAALRHLAGRFARSHGFEAEVRIGPLEPVPIELQQVIYRVAQESLQNAAKHSGATNVRISLQEADKAIIRLCVADNGAGFSLDAAGRKADSFGLGGMRERAALLGGSLSVRTAAGKGASITLLLPRPPG